MRERKRLESMLSLEGDLARRTGDIAAYFDLAGEGENVTAELQRELESLRELVDRVETETLLSGDHDGLNAIMTIHPGAGGTESQDWAEMLLRMYLRWPNGRDSRPRCTTTSPAKKRVSSPRRLRDWAVCVWLLDQRDWCAPIGADFSFRSGEAAAHVVCQRVCFSEIDDSIEVNIKPDDIRIDTYRSSGKGGQHVNTTDSAVRITHIPRLGCQLPE